MGSARSDWQHVVDSHLLRHLAVKDASRGSRWPLAALLTGWVLAAVAMAGPAWEKLPVPALDRQDPTVIVLSLAQSMNATDQRPNRLIAARHKIEDLLTRLRGGQVGLVVFADAPFVAAPLTEDGRIVAQMLPELATNLMPVLANRLDLAIGKAVELLKNAAAERGRIVVLTDGAGDSPERSIEAARAASLAGHTLSVIGVGTAQGAPLTDFGGEAVRSLDQSTVTTRLDEAQLTSLAAAGGGRFTQLAVDDRDLDRVLSRSLGTASARATQAGDVAADQWADMGPWLLLAVMLLAPLAFRRGWIAVLLIGGALCGGLPISRAYAGGPAPDTRWADLWQRPDQQGASAFQKKDYGEAGRSFEDPSWRASALYKDGNYAAAAEAFSRVPGADYNRGNALARTGQLREALDAYEAALKADPSNADAIYNRDLVRKLLDQQQNKDDQDKNDQGGGGSGGDSSQQQGDGSGKDGKGGGEASGGSGSQKPQESGQGGGQGQPPHDQRGSPGNSQAKDKPEPPKNEAKNELPKKDPPKPEPPKPEPPKQATSKKDPPKKDPPKQEDAKQDPAANDPKPEAPPSREAGNSAGKDSKPPEPPPGGDRQDPAKPDPGKPADSQPPPTPAKASAERREGENGNVGQVMAMPGQPANEQAQNREQTLRLVPDDPTGLLRARIRSHYLGVAVPVSGN